MGSALQNIVAGEGRQFVHEATRVHSVKAGGGGSCSGCTASVTVSALSNPTARARDADNVDVRFPRLAKGKL